MSSWVYKYYVIFGSFITLFSLSKEVSSFTTPTTFGKHTSKTFQETQETTRTGVRLFLQKPSNQTLSEFKIKQTLLGMEKLHKRLHASGVTDHFFANDEDGTDQLAPYKLDNQELQRVEHGQMKDISAVHVKTLIWKGVYLQSSLSSTQKEGESQIIQDQNETFYFVTALRVQDKVELKLLRNIIKKKFPKQKGTLIVQLAERNVAEDITGFASGSMPPGWHKTPLKLFVDDYIIEDASMTKPASEESTNNFEGDEVSLRMMEDFPSRDDHFSNVMLSVGSGSIDYSLHVSLKALLESSHTLESENGGITLEEGIRRERLVCSFTKARAKENYKHHQRMHSLKVNAQRDTNRTESRQRNAIIEKTVNGKITRRSFQLTSRKKGKVAQIREMIKQIGDDYPSYMSVIETKIEGSKFTSEVNKNALHYASWKGDLETVTLLVNTARQFSETKDLVNFISTGEGNYGKTAIFYSITQCRDDAVLLLLSLGANLLIVNNKGQTPCSLAYNHLKPETCEFMYQTEDAQLKKGGEFVNYRSTHSDGSRYGDLDPRFLDAKDVNMGNDILAELDISKMQLEEVAMNKSLPRCVRVTTPKWREESWIKQQEKLKQVTLNTTNTKEKLFSDSIEVTRGREKKLKQDRLNDTEKFVHTKKGNDSYVSQSKTIVTSREGEVINIENLQQLRLEDVLKIRPDGNTRYELIDCEEGIRAFHATINETRAEIELVPDRDTSIISTSWGLDCEWRPSRLPGEHNPVATLQLSSSSRSFVIDLQTLCQSNVKNANEDLTVIETLLSSAIAALFADLRIRILGFGIAQDITKLAASFPHLPCFREIHCVLDLHTLSRIIYPGTSKQYMSSLQKTVAILLKKRLDKTEQCSEWDQRPLSQSQLEYASLDAAVLPSLLREMMTKNSLVDEDQGLFFNKKSHLQQSYRYLFVKDDAAYRISLGSIKTSMGIRVARQVWGTFKTVPDLPEVIPLQEQTQHVLQSSTKREAKKEAKKKTERYVKAKRNPINLDVLTGDLDNLPVVGQILGYTKDSCIERVLGNQILNSLPEESHLKFNRRGGVIEVANAWLLFVNFGVGRVYHKYRNEFLDNGKKITFTVSPTRYEDSDLLQTLIASSNDGKGEFWNSSLARKSVLLFIRGSTKEKFTFCGECKYSAHEEKGDLVDLLLELKNYDALFEKGHDGEPSVYMNVVAQNTAA